MKESLLAYRSTILGIALLLFDAYIYVYKEVRDNWVLGVVFLVGIYCIFNKQDSLLELIEKKLLSLFKDKDTE